MPHQVGCQSHMNNASPPGEEDHCYCQGQPGKIGHLSAGLYVFNVQPGCRITGTSWALRLSALLRLSSKAEWALLVVDIWLLNLSHLISSDVSYEIMDTPSWKDLAVIQDIKLDKLTKWLVTVMFCTTRH